MANRSKTLVLVDFPNLFYRGFHVHPNLQWQGVPTGGAYGFITQLATVVDFHMPDTLVICDDARPYARCLMFPDYKKRRSLVERTPEEMRRFSVNFKIATEFVELLGLPFFKTVGAEADDLIAALAKNHERDFHRIVIVSNDSDLFQLLDQQNLSVACGLGKKKRLVDGATFLAEHKGLKCAKDWLLINALTGGHNDLPGLKGVGIKRAMSWYWDMRRKRETKLTKLVQENSELLSLNYFLGELPFPGVSNWSSVTLPQRVFRGYDSRELVRFLARYGIKLTGLMHRAFDSLN